MDQGINIAGVQFRRAGKIYDFRYDELSLNVGDHVVVDTERGPSLARVVMLKFETETKNADRELKSIMRRAGKKELDKKSKITVEEIKSFTKDRIQTLKLDMNVLTAEVQFGGSKITVFFTAPGRVDFRELVKDLASGLKSRVELKQVGARDETKLIGGTGICGREFCCSSFLREFVPVSIKMAKNQNLALNPNKVSGGCGRLLCCLTYEDETYSSLRKNIPPRGTRVFIPEIGGYGNVIKGDVLNQEVLLENERGQQETYSLDDVEVVAKNAGSSRDKSKEESIEWGDELDLAALEQFSEDSKSGGKKQSPRGGRNQRDGKGRNNRSNNRHDRSADKNSQKPRGDRGDKEENKNEKDSQSSKPDKARNKYNKRHGNKNKDPRNKDGSGRDQGGKSGNQNNKASDNSDGNQKGSNQNKKRRGNRYNKKKGSGSQDD